MYKFIIKPLLFKLNPESAHHFIAFFLQYAWVGKIIFFFNKIFYPVISKPITVFGIHFPNRIGLAAGFDKNAVMLHGMAGVGFGFIEIGTLTPLAQPGNDKPRLFRLPQDVALINRMGFNNEGVDEAIPFLKNKPKGLIVGGNIGKNKATPNHLATNDYLICMQKLHDYVDYFVVNVSSPNTPGLRELQEKEPLTNLLNSLVLENNKFKTPKPILLKIAPDLSENQLDDIIEIFFITQIAGIIATNTTIDRSKLNTSSTVLEKIGQGGLSGKPLSKQSNWVISYLHKKSNGKIPIIGVGGINSVKDAQEKIDAGATLVQIYTGFIYEGPGLVRKIAGSI